MAENVSDRILERLSQWGVERVYSYPGDGFNALLGALQRRGNDPMFVQTRHEEMSAFMATAHAKWTGQAGVCMATSGPGAIHLLNGLYDAKLDHQPVVAIVGQTNMSALGGDYQQEVDLLSLFKDVAGYLQMVGTSEQIPAVLDRAFRVALSERTVAVLVVPADVQEMEYQPPTHEFKMVPGSLGWSRSRVLPEPSEVQRAARILNEGERVGILIGQGARGAAAEVVEVADRLGAGVAKALLGKDVLSDELPFVTGAIGLLGTKPSYDMMMGCDTFLMIGSSLPYTQFLPEFGQARGIQIDIDGRMIGLRYPMEVNLIGDAQSTLAELLPLLERKEDRSWRQEIEDGVARWWDIVEARAMQDAHPLNPQRVFWELSPQLPGNAIVTADSGSAANWYARDLKFREGMRGSLSGTLATMGSAMPYAVAAKFCHPDRPAIALVGDGAMQMNGNAELLTVAKYWQQWSDPRLVVLVLNNSDLNQVTWEMRAMEGVPKFEETQVLPDMNYAEYARLVGLDGIRIDRPDDVADAWRRALGADRPVVIDAVVDPEIPPLPPHVELDDAKAMMRAVLKQDPNAADMIKHAFEGKAQEFLQRG
ncbi:thiamine pyrophosphate-requiring protein [Egibacter rhizosphaerae]|uniref:Thiamine pyrophosphate-requiring protein n=1 Tax=Egibacter rhizosphaerae TaxID=1670831 RepID=A0A411YB10_9ACTN|nr:thiamine pyrophosphate-requiring protein [Egibacter rhizosphaerae]QBI18400.1 thiamine pyrophosphate-requiring protein [Egibacter rhizosphaerae]